MWFEGRRGYVNIDPQRGEQNSKGNVVKLLGRAEHHLRCMLSVSMLWGFSPGSFKILECRG